MSDDEDAWKELRREAKIPEESIRPPARPARKPARPVPPGGTKRLTWTPGPTPEPEQGPRLPYPWETERFNPADPEVLAHAHKGREPALPGFRLGGTVLEGGGERWVVTQSLCNWWSVDTWLTYPLGPEWGEDPSQAITRFEKAWRLEAQRIAGRS